MALGANQQDIWIQVLRREMRSVTVGLCAGLLGAMALTRFLTNLLFEVRALDLLTFVVAPMVLATIAALSCYLPARRAARLDPMEALRHQ